MSNLTGKQKLFIEKYLQCWNGTQAAREAGYEGDDPTLAVTASRTLRNAKVKEEIRARLEVEMMSANEVLWRLGEQARANIDEFLTFGVNEDGNTYWRLDLEKAKEAGLLGLVKKLKYNAKGYPEIELYDAQKALELIGKRHAMFTDKTEVVGLDDVLRSLPKEFGEAVRRELVQLIREE